MMMYEQEVIEQLKEKYGSYNAWQSIVNIMNAYPTPDTRAMGEMALNELIYMQKRIKELESKAAKWDDPQTQADLELAAAVRKAFEDKEYCKFVGEFHIIEVKSARGLIDWFREQNQLGKV